MAPRAKKATPAADKAITAPMAAAVPDSITRLSLAHKRKLAKHAMVASLAVLTVTAVTGVHKKGLSRSLHVTSGVALIGLALWHHSLYTRKKAAQCPAPAL